MKKYALFAGFDYYPCGGWDDFKGGFDSPDEAIGWADKTLDWNYINWAQVVNLETLKIEWERCDADLKWEKV